MGLKQFFEHQRHAANSASGADTCKSGAILKDCAFLFAAELPMVLIVPINYV
jgi:hypothetical protein